MFVWQGADPTCQGTGFLAKAPNGKIAAVTSGHFLNRDGPRLTEARWLDVRTNEVAIRLTKSWGPPGGEGVTEPVVDLRGDYLLMPVDEKVADELVLELDTRKQPAVGERVWLPNKDSDAKLGYELVSGKVTEATEKYSTVELDRAIKLQSQSGSPFISQSTGKVIGTLSRAPGSEGKTVLVLAPARALVDALSREGNFPLLLDVIGKAKKRGKPNDCCSR
ncbi:MAG: hypothetical protein K2R98_23725 [Gemmataceae bacterium]|nr:hypothetical protein [Gemmataceae bacterium]